MTVVRQALEQDEGHASSRSPGSRYDGDYLGWIEEQLALLRAGRLGEIDAGNLAEELSDMGRAEISRLESALKVLLMHMLKWDQQPEHRTRSWVASIREQRRRYVRPLKRSPSLKAKRDEALADAYEDARDWAAYETHLPPSEFPTTCPYTWDDILERPFEDDSVR